MSRIIFLIRNQVKRIGKDNLLLLLSVYPLLLAATGRYLVPYLRMVFIDKFDLALHYPAIFTFFILANPYIYGSLAAFLLLDEREENVLEAVRVTPLPMKHYLFTKVTFFTNLSFVSGLFITEIVGFMKLSLMSSIILNALLALAAPFNMVLINSFAKNRLEGFAIVKGSGMLIMLPLAAFYIPAPFKWIVGILPGFWPAMSLSALLDTGIQGTLYWIFTLIGFVYILVLTKLLNLKFEKSIS